MAAIELDPFGPVVSLPGHLEQKHTQKKKKKKKNHKKKSTDTPLCESPNSTAQEIK
jgi:hypothetical protein